MHCLFPGCVSSSSTSISLYFILFYFLKLFQTLTLNLSARRDAREGTVSEEKAQPEISHFSIRRFVLSLIRYRKGDKVGSKMINLPPDSRGHPLILLLNPTTPPPPWLLVHRPSRGFEESQSFAISMEIKPDIKTNYSVFFSLQVQYANNVYQAIYLESDNTFGCLPLIVSTPQHSRAVLIAPIATAAEATINMRSKSVHLKTATPDPHTSS